MADQAAATDGESVCTDQYRRDELRVKKALLFIEKNYGAAITPGEIAGSAAISVSTCLRLFRSILGTTPNRYLMTYRLQRAAEELAHPEGRTIAAIAFSCGFAYASYFDRCFLAAYGITPSGYIHHLQKQQE